MTFNQAIDIIDTDRFVQSYIITDQAVCVIEIPDKVVFIIIESLIEKS